MPTSTKNRLPLSLGFSSRHSSSLSPKNNCVKLLIALIGFCLLVTLLLSFVLFKSTNPTATVGAGRGQNGQNLALPHGDRDPLFHIESHHGREAHSEAPQDHRLAIIVPLRDRDAELRTFGPHIHSYLSRKRIQHEIITVKQSVSPLRFNRAALINVGYLHAVNNTRCDYIAMHDVDLLPLNEELPYEYPNTPNSVVHVSSPDYHPKYNYSKFIGGVLLVPIEIYSRVNGMSNLYWGWGLEDDEFYVRLKQAGVEILRPPTNLSTNRTNTFKHLHGANRARDYAKCFDQLKRTRRRDRLTGLNNVNYTVTSVEHIPIGNAPSVPVTILNVELHCDRVLSPWCDCGSGGANSANANLKKVKKRKKVPPAAV